MIRIAHSTFAQLRHQLASTAGAIDRIASVAKDAGDLLVQLVAVGDEDDAGIGIVFQNPFGRQNRFELGRGARRCTRSATVQMKGGQSGRRA